MWDWTGHMGGWWWLAAPLMIAFIIWAVITLVRRNEAPRTRATPEDVLAERFARGELDEVEYRHRRELVRSH